MTCIGFIYLWYDKKRKMFYLGSHKGKINDGYICSSKHMLKEYRLRPNDFKRKIIEKCTNDNLLIREQYWLNQIKSKELYYNSCKYYNVKRFAAGGDTIEHHIDRDTIIKNRYGKKHSDAIKQAYLNRTDEQKRLQIERHIISLHKTYSSVDYKFYQEKQISVFVNNQLYKQYRSISALAKDINVDRSTLTLRIFEGKWVIKQKRKHPFSVGDIITFE
jgi:hypothetical protein